MARHCDVCGADSNESGAPIDGMNGCPTCGALVCDRHTGVPDPFVPHTTSQHRSEVADDEQWDKHTQRHRQGDRKHGADKQDDEADATAGPSRR